MSWFDLGVNLLSSQFDSDREQVLARAHQAGISKLLLIASDLTETAHNQHWCSQHTACVSTAGVHPHQAEHIADDWLEQLRQLVAHPSVVAIGECGLDFNRNFSSQSAQVTVFSAQLALAQELQLPVYLHERDAFTTQIALLKEHHVRHGIAHCFTGNSDQLKAYLDLGLYIGITGWLCDERRNQELVAALQYLPLDRICLETDAPYLLPRTLQPKPKSRRNEPAFLLAIAQQVAKLKNITLEQLQQHCWHNSQTLLQQAGGAE
ncbi:TatD family hydrolase [Alkalimonas sp. NCh-2]|uniref:TatD family hydrolase n=1 Tax=Alkalimonas sp. NCh-2 TaxID=3144846 RepID=UPI0031F6BFF4